MSFRKIYTMLIVLTLLFLALLMSACSSESATEVTSEPEATVEPEIPTEVVEPTTEPVDILPTAAPGEATLTANENVRVRSGPSQQYPVYTNLTGGSTAKLLGVSQDGTYLAIDVPLVAPNTGWVDINFATVSGAEDLPIIEAPPVPPSAEFVGVQPGDPTLIATDAIYVHSGPGEPYPAYGIAEAGSKGLAIGVSEDGDWWVVRIDPEIVGEGSGWVQKEYVTTENVGDDLPVIKTPPLPESGELPAPDPNGPYGVASDYVSVRSGPGTNYAVLVVAAPSASGEIVGKSADGAWWQFNISTDYSTDGLGWVNAAYVIAYNVESIPVVDSPPAPAVTPTSPNQPEGSYSCILVSQDPLDGTVLQTGEAFDMAWEVQNVGTESWTVADTVISKVGAEVDQPLSTVDTLSLSDQVDPGSTYTVLVPMTAPDFAGQFGEYWTIVLGDQTVCYFYNVIQVQE